MRVHREFAEIEALENAWRTLTPAGSNPFQTFAWNQACYRLYAGTTQRPLLFELRDGGDTVALLPCYREGRAIRLAGDRVCDGQDVLAADETAAAAMIREALRWMRREAPGAHLHFDRLSGEGTLHRTLRRGGIPQDFLFSETPRPPRFRAESRGGLEAFLTSLPRTTNRDLRRRLRRLEREAASARVTVLRDYEVRVDALWNAAAFHSAHFPNPRTSPFRDPRLIDLLGRVAKDPETGFQLAVLEHEGETLAVDFGFVRSGRYHGFLSGSDPARARLAPGECLFLLRIDRWVSQESVRTLDFPAGNELRTQVGARATACPIWSVRLLPPTLRNRALHLRLESEKRIRDLAGRIHEREDPAPV